MYKFSKSYNGYNIEEVNQFLDDVIMHVEKIIDNSKRKDKEKKKKKKELNENGINNETIIKAKKYDELSKDFNNIVKFTNDAKEYFNKIALEERNIILKDAKYNADIIINDALNKSKEVEYQMKILNDNIKLFKSKLKDNIRQQIKLLKEIDEYENKR